MYWQIGDAIRTLQDVDGCGTTVVVDRFATVRRTPGAAPHDGVRDCRRWGQAPGGLSRSMRYDGDRLTRRTAPTLAIAIPTIGATMAPVGSRPKGMASGQGGLRR